MINSFSNLDTIFIVHYNTKANSIDDNDLRFLRKRLKNKNAILLEPSNFKSAGILAAHGNKSIIGSDVSDWDKYQTYFFPELRFRINTFSDFKLLLKKDFNIVKTHLEQKNYENVNIKIFNEKEFIIPIYNDINVIVGERGTGKTEILNSIKNYFESKGNNDVITYSGSEINNKYNDLLKNAYSNYDVSKHIIIEDFNLDFIYKWSVPRIITTDYYYRWKVNSNIRVKNKIFNLRFNSLINTNKFEIEKNYFIDVSKNIIKILRNREFIEKSSNKKQFDEYRVSFGKIFDDIRTKFLISFCSIYSLKLTKFTIEVLKSLYQMKKGIFLVPTNTGFSDFFLKHIGLKQKLKRANKIINDCPSLIEYRLGDLPNNNALYLDKEISPNPDRQTRDTKFVRLQGSDNFNFEDLKEIKSCIENTYKKCFSIELGVAIKKLRENMHKFKIYSTKDFYGVTLKTTDDNFGIYNPSSGEKAIIILQNILKKTDKNVFILDEPELSLGNEYINDVILPALKGLVNLGKKIIIATHDANIGVRTLPLQIIYRVYLGNNNYETYIGNPFENKLYSTSNPLKYKIWSDVAVEILEGGRSAFCDRSEFYEKKIN